MERSLRKWRARDKCFYGRRGNIFRPRTFIRYGRPMQEAIVGNSEKPVGG